MAAPPKQVRDRSYGEGRRLSVVDQAGVWLSARQVRRAVPDFRGKRVGDFGCGYEASFARSILEDAKSVVLVDVSLSPDLGTHPKVSAIEGVLPDALSGLEDASLDVVTCNSVLEHLWHPQETLDAFFRLTARGGICLVNVPSWRGKRWLELAAFRLNLSPPDEMDDHKMYYDPRQLWPMLVKAGFTPRNLRVFRHKFGLNTFAVCRKP
jgi:2-polyprenyl-3-methyl-5-hydroxy-6-metoxy-1,4-benzoquinol methylase